MSGRSGRRSTLMSRDYDDLRERLGSILGTSQPFWSVSKRHIPNIPKLNLKGRVNRLSMNSIGSMSAFKNKWSSPISKMPRLSFGMNSHFRGISDIKPL